MTDILQTEQGDIDATLNDLHYVNGAFEVEQLLRQRLRTFLGEWFLDTTIGVPYFQDIMKKNPNPVSVDAAFKTEILETPGILELFEFELDLNLALRQLNVAFRAISTDGIIDFSEVIET